MTASTGSGVTGSRIQSTTSPTRLMFAVGVLVGAVLLLTGCSGGGGAPDKPLYVGGIPDQDVSVLEARFNGMADYLSAQLHLDVRYVPSTDYAALVTAFESGDILVGWFGGLTGVQARLAVDGAQAIAQRPIDAEFQSVFIVGSDVEATGLADLAGKTFTFGSESSTSGHLMPRFFLTEAGVDPDTDLDGAPGYSGSHDKTWQLVEAGAYQAGALNIAVWDRAVADGQVDTSRVRVLEVTPPYYDYHWVVNPLIDERYGDGTIEALTAALLGMGDDPAAAEVLENFQADSFIATTNANYDSIEQVARSLGLIDG